ncbi:hypothetical protein KUTeg_001133 [Tegillarca granosa]|uniref:Uncharacterized protein n=1 Tax=Tegillarca granosa TaxID=220873 RepID=A0ABQ9FVM0_TEGGR|nr:hypothetical protein KUTeg_001133 [Tegillarca granosa]
MPSCPFRKGRNEDMALGLYIYAAVHQPVVKINIDSQIRFVCKTDEDKIVIVIHHLRRRGLSVIPSREGGLSEVLSSQASCVSLAHLDKGLKGGIIGCQVFNQIPNISSTVLSEFNYYFNPVE